MKEDNVYQAVREALDAFRLAENEFNRPIEDMVTLCACSHTRACVDRFLAAFLQRDGDAAPAPQSTDELLLACAGREAAFRDIDLGCFACRHDDGACDTAYCLSVDKVTACFETARTVKDLVLSRLRWSESDFV